MRLNKGKIVGEREESIPIIQTDPRVQPGQGQGQAFLQEENQNILIKPSYPSTEV